MTKQEAASLLGLSPRSISRKMKEGVLPYRRLRNGRAVRIRKVDVERLLKPTR
ncbi:helix-turn-helix domain-containing protein [Sanyastnella coralliicola]|uniref:helix-turn-helix domain-containing protein n=1 Tax=Sanyastnella coralliicola TaxID=3069118 RepID=UPI003312FF91